MRKRGNWSVEELGRLRAGYGRKPVSQLARELNRTPEAVLDRAHRLYPDAPRPGALTRGEEATLRLMVGVADLATMARILRRAEAAVVAVLEDWAGRRRGGRFQPWELRHLRACWATRPDWALALVLGRDDEALRAKARELCLGKSKTLESVPLPGFERVVVLHPQPPLRMPRWTGVELDRLVALYPYRSNLEIARELDRSVKSVVAKAAELGLRKSRRRLREMGRENVSLRRRRRGGA
ncbi:MAG: hypothetical protein R3F30_04170 [Planctomycetota bacterium]